MPTARHARSWIAVTLRKFDVLEDPQRIFGEYLVQRALLRSLLSVGEQSYKISYTN